MLLVVIAEPLPYHAVEDDRRAMFHSPVSHKVVFDKATAPLKMTRKNLLHLPDKGDTRPGDCAVHQRSGSYLRSVHVDVTNAPHYIYIYVPCAI